MIANRIKKTANFTVVDNGYLNDANLSFKAKGIMTYILSLPEDWVVYYDEIITHARDGIKSFRSGIDELINEGYIKRYPIRERGEIVRWEFEVSERKSPIGQNVEVAKEDIEKENLPKADLKKDILLNTNSSITDISNMDNTKNLNNTSSFETLIHEWNSLGDLVKPIDRILGNPLWMFGVSKLIDEYGMDKVVLTMRSIRTNTYAHRYVVSFDWFLRDMNFDRLLADLPYK